MQQERHEIIRDILSRAGFVNVQELVAEFHVSSETIRRDLECMEKDGLLKRVHGGAVSAHPHISESAYQIRRNDHTQEKKAIAAAAAALVTDGDTLLIAPGTTTLEFSSFLRQRKNLTVITNSLPVASELANCPSIHVHFLGGSVQGEDYSTSGITAMENLDHFNPNKLIIGVAGITPEHGLTDYRSEESALLHLFTERVPCVIGIADHSKFGMVSTYNICSASRLTHLVTDPRTPDALSNPYKKMGVQVHVVSAESD